MADRRRFLWLTALMLAGMPSLLAAQPAQKLDPAVWGSDHVGRPVPEFTSGDECLFCHRMDVGPTWGTNRHGQTVRTAESTEVGLVMLRKSPAFRDLADEVEFILGRNNRLRFLKRAEGSGRLDLLSVEWNPPQPDSEGRLMVTESPHWDHRKFGESCAGCHATGVDPIQRTFGAVSLDCFVCHGEVPEQHTTQGSLVVLSPHRRDSAPVITSICAQCHLRTGTSRSTGLPYPNNFVPGDNVFRDFRVDLSEAALQKLNPADRHVQENVRDVVLLGQTVVTCLSCHDVHDQSSQKHQLLADSNLCLNCHKRGTKKDRVPYAVHSQVCGY